MPTGEVPASAQYEHGWRDLRRREVRLWFVSLSFVPGVLLTLMTMGLFRDYLPRHFGRCTGAVWLAACLTIGLHYRMFRCPRCRRFFFEWSLAQQSHGCVHCKLPRWANSELAGT
jgi:hypothetical protein